MRGNQAPSYDDARRSACQTSILHSIIFYIPRRRHQLQHDDDAHQDECDEANTRALNRTNTNTCAHSSNTCIFAHHSTRQPKAQQRKNNPTLYNVIDQIIYLPQTQHVFLSLTHLEEDRHCCVGIEMHNRRPLPIMEHQRPRSPLRKHAPKRESRTERLNARLAPKPNAQNNNEQDLLFLG